MIVFQPFLYNPFAPFGPVIEKCGGEFTFIDRSPIDIITSGDAEDVPWITGNVSEEGLFPAARKEPFNIHTSATSEYC